MSEHGDLTGWREALEVLVTALERTGERGWLVGGCLRDALLGLPVHDLDLAVIGDPGALVRSAHLPGCRAVVPLQQAVRVVFGGSGEHTLDVAHVHGGSIEADLAGRDYTLNALALPLAAREELLARLVSTTACDQSPAVSSSLSALSSLIDPLGGRADVVARRLVVASATALRADPARILRGARMVAALRLSAPESTVRSMREAAPGLVAIARERLSAELSLLFGLARADAGWRVLRAGGALPWLFPEVRALTDEAEEVERHLLASQAALAPLHPQAEGPHRSESDTANVGCLVGLARIPELRAWLDGGAPHGGCRIALVCWGVLALALGSQGALTGEPSSAVTSAHVPQSGPLPVLTPGGTARLVARAVVREAAMARELLLAEPFSRARWRQLFERVRGIEGGGVYVVLAVLAREAALALEAPTRRSALVRMCARGGAVISGLLRDPAAWLPPSLLAGNELMQQLGIAPGPLVGELMRAIRQAQLEERIATSDEALALARALAEAASSRPSEPAP